MARSLFICFVPFHRRVLLPPYKSRLHFTTELNYFINISQIDMNVGSLHRASAGFISISARWPHCAFQAFIYEEASTTSPDAQIPLLESCLFDTFWFIVTRGWYLLRVAWRIQKYINFMGIVPWNIHTPCINYNEKEGIMRVAYTRQMSEKDTEKMYFCNI